MNNDLIDVWDIQTFDDGLLAGLRSNADLIRDYVRVDRENCRERKQPGCTYPYPANPHTEKYHQLLLDLESTMKTRTIRAWHYTRLTDDEVGIIQKNGIYVSTLKTTRLRLDEQVASGSFSIQTAERLFAASPLHRPDQLNARSGRFWMTSHPLATDDDGVKLLLSHWGGEAIYFWLDDIGLETLVKSVGKPRVLELAVPLDTTSRSHLAGEAVVATFGRTLACELDRGYFDFYSLNALPAEAVIRIHTDGQPLFAALAREYPVGFREATTN